MRSRIIGRLLVASAVTALCGAGCVGSAISHPGVEAESSGSTDMALDPKVVFAQQVQPLLATDCGACHALPGSSYPQWLVGTQSEDIYTVFTQWPNMIGATPATSLILTKATHEGPSYRDGTTAIIKSHVAAISDFITLYNSVGGAHADSDMGVSAQLPPVAPSMGTLQSISLLPLGSEYAGMTLSFTPKNVGTTELSLEGITLTGTAKAGVTVAGLIVAVYTPDGSTTMDVDTDFDTDTYTAYAGAPALVGTTIRPYTTGQKVGFSFASVALASASGDMGPAVGCKDVAGFAAFKTNLEGGNGETLRCVSCHDTGGPGNSAFNMSGFSDSTKDAQSCATTLDYTTPTMPSSSDIYLKVSGGKSHQGGTLSTASQKTFLDALTSWISNEQ